MSTGYALFLVSVTIGKHYNYNYVANLLLVQSYDNGRLVDTDTFFDYVELVEEPLKALLITNKYG